MKSGENTWIAKGSGKRKKPTAKGEKKHDRLRVPKKAKREPGVVSIGKKDR